LNSDTLIQTDAMLQYGALRSFRNGPLAPFIGDDIFEVGKAKLPIEGSFDTVFAGYRLQDISDYRSALQAWFNVVRIGGYLVVVVPHAFLYERQLALPSRFRPEQRRLYTPRALIEEIEESLVPNSYRVRWLGDRDDGYDYAELGELEPVGAHDVVLVIERIALPAWRLLDTVEDTPAIKPEFAFETPRTRVEAASRKPVGRILILKLDHLGDFIMGLPALEKARQVFADSEITLVVGSWNVGIARDLNVADHVLQFDVFPRNSSEEQVDVVGKTALFQDLIVGEYDLRSDPDTRFLLRSVRAGLRAGIGTRARFPFLDIFLPIDATRNEPETARIDEFTHNMFASYPEAVRGDFRISCAKEDAQAVSAMIWGPYRPLRPGRYVFEPFIELAPTGAGLLSLDIALDTKWVVHKHVPAPQPVRLEFTVDKPGSLFEFRIWALEGVEAIDFSFFGGRLIREGAASVLHQSEYLALLIELVKMRVSGFGMLQEAEASE
jgi:hypothetical protein